MKTLTQIRTMIFMVIMTWLTANASLAQSDSIQWKSFVKYHDVTKIFYDEYISSAHCSYGAPLVFLDTIFVSGPQGVRSTPMPVQGVNAFLDSIKYPELARRAGITGSVMLTASVDSLGIVGDVQVNHSDYEIFNKVSIAALERARFGVPLIYGKPSNVHVVVVLSFAIERRRNVDIEEMIIDRRPYYTITLENEGTVLYEGGDHSKKIGKIDIYKFNGITSLIYAIHFFRMNELYASGITDLPWLSIVVKTPTETKKVTTDYYQPLNEIATLVDYITKDISWKKIEN